MDGRGFLVGLTIPIAMFLIALPLAPRMWAAVPALTDCNGNGIEDSRDIDSGNSLDLNSNGIPDECELIYGGVESISAQTGGSQVLGLNAGPALAGYTYRVFGSLGGASPGVDLGGVHLPLNAQDPYFEFTWLYANTAPLLKSTGVLDENGRAETAFSLTATAGQQFVGETFTHAFVVYDPQGLPLLASNWIPVTVLP